MMNLGQMLRAFDAVMAFRDAAKRFRSDAPPATDIATQTPSPAFGNASIAARSSRMGTG